MITKKSLDRYLPFSAKRQKSINISNKLDREERNAMRASRQSMPAIKVRLLVTDVTLLNCFGRYDYYRNKETRQ